VASARRFVGSVFAGLLDEPRHRDVELLVSEVVTNGVVHAATAMELVVCAEDHHVRVELIDHGAGEPEIRSTTGSDGGFGLRIVEHLALRWGVRHGRGAKAVWFEL
jgi:anti-sigma regulatory factor (Ser/Thr protein kinase)